MHILEWIVIQAYVHTCLKLNVVGFLIMISPIKFFTTADDDNNGKLRDSSWKTWEFSADNNISKVGSTVFCADPDSSSQGSSQPALSRSSCQPSR